MKPKRLLDADQVWNDAQFALQDFGFGVGHAPAFFRAFNDEMDGKRGISDGFALFIAH